MNNCSGYQLDDTLQVKVVPGRTPVQQIYQVNSGPNPNNCLVYPKMQQDDQGTAAGNSSSPGWDRCPGGLTRTIVVLNPEDPGAAARDGCTGNPQGP